MKFYELSGATVESETLAGEYKEGRSIGALCIGREHLFLRTGLKTRVLPFDGIHRVFRRVESVPAKMCCGKGNFDLERLVFCNDAEEEIAEVKLPDSKAAMIAYDVLTKKLPDAVFGVAKGAAP